MLRYERVNTCAECGMCSTGHSCDPVRQPLRKYGGLRLTSDGFDCALPVALDSHSVCSYGCLYCFSDNLAQHRAAAGHEVGQTPLRYFQGALIPKDRNDKGDVLYEYRGLPHRENPEEPYWTIL